MDARRGKAQYDIALGHVFGIEHLWTVYRTDAKTGQVVIIGIHDAGMLRHLSTNERATRLTATLGDAAHHLGDVVASELADGDVIEKEQRLGPAGQHVVHAHGDQVDAHGIVLASHLSQGELGSHAIGPAHENGIVHLLERRG